jgi:hypothetical protein
MGKWKGLRKWKEEFGPELGKELWLEARRHKRKRTLKMLEGVPVIGAIAKLILKVP